MILRPRQKTFVANCLNALGEHGNTLGVANTGFGKTIALSAIVGEQINGTGRALIMAHRDELTIQNSNAFRKVVPGVPISLFNAQQKSWRGRATFGMVQTLANNIDDMPKIDLLVIDEAHHSASASYQKVIGKVREVNPEAKILGVTATPERSDRKGLANTFTNVADIVTIAEMVQAGHLVPPKAMVIDIGTQESLRCLKRGAGDYDQAEVEAIQNTTIHNNQIVEKWMQKASERPTVAFCSTIKHALDLRDTFREMNVEAETVHGEMPVKERRAILAASARGDVPVLTNPMILTEGYDNPLLSCCLLLRISSHKSTVIQMIGRVLRKLDPRKHPGRVKTEALILDFGISLLTHGNLTADVRLRYKDDDKEPGEAKKKTCPDCKAQLPIQTRECPLCGFEFKVELLEGGFYNEVEELRLIEIDLLNSSPFRWVSLFESGKVLIATGFESWAAVCSMDGNNWFAIGGKGKDAELLTIANRVGAIASADDFMRCNEKSTSAKKASIWMREPASDKQIQILGRLGFPGHYTKIEAAAFLTFGFNQKSIERVMGVVG